MVCGVLCVWSVLSPVVLCCVVLCCLYGLVLCVCVCVCGVPSFLPVPARRRCAIQNEDPIARSIGKKIKVQSLFSELEHLEIRL